MVSGMEYTLIIMRHLISMVSGQQIFFIYTQGCSLEQLKNTAIVPTCVYELSSMILLVLWKPPSLLSLIFSLHVKLPHRETPQRKVKAGKGTIPLLLSKGLWRALTVE